MTAETAKKLLSDHFTREVEMLPEAAVDEIIAGRNVQEVKVSCSSQIDLAGAVAVLTLAELCQIHS
jgi:hypothetical protein